MARQRSRQAWPVLAYKFWIQPTHVPQQVWDRAKQMHALWNQLVDLCEAASERIHTAELALSQGEKKELYADLDVALGQVIAQSELNWECREFISDRFRVAVQTAIKRMKNGVPAREAGFPRKRISLKKIAIPHRYTGGGVPVCKLFRTHPPKSIKRFWLNPVPQRAYIDNGGGHKRLRYTEGFFGLGEVKMPFRALIHREIPEEAIVKNAVLIGRHSRQFGWEWAIALTCELPPSPIVIESTGRVCGLDLGWRKFDTYLRIGMLVDNAGNVIELRLPLTMSNRPTRNFNRWIDDQTTRADADRIYESWQDIREATSLADKSLESAKGEVAALAEGKEWPDDIRASLSQIAHMGPGGLIRLLGALREAGVGQDLQNLIAAWKEQDHKAQRRIHSARLRLTRRRQWLYQNLGAWIAEDYDIIAWEANLGLKAMAEEGEKTAALKGADRYRHIAAIGEFKSILRHQANKRQALLIDGGSAYSSITCFTCGTRTTGGAQLTLECPNGHHFDQDENAARSFLSKIDQKVITDCNLRHDVVRALPPAIAVPDILTTAAVPQFPARFAVGIESEMATAV